MGKPTRPTTGGATWEGLRQRVMDGSGLRPEGTISLSTPIVSVQDGPRMAGIANFKGKKAAPFKKGGGRRAKVLAAKTAVKRATAKKRLRDTDNDGD